MHFLTAICTIMLKFRQKSFMLAEIMSSRVPWKRFFFWAFAGSLVFHLLAAWFSIGYLYLDEQCQIMEFAGYKLGFIPGKWLPWEFNSQIRQAIQPFIVVMLYKALDFFHIANPFLCSLILRILSSILGWFSIMLLTKELSKLIASEFWKRFMVLLASFIWFIPYTQSHFSSESLSGSLFFISVALVMASKQKDYLTKKSIFSLLIAGLCAGLAFVIRNQTIFFIGGLGLWCIIIGKYSFKKISLLTIPAILMIGLGFLIDHWFYGKWVFTAYNYYHVNIALDKVSSFGVTPFYYYFYIYYLNLFPPFSVFFMGVIIYAWFRYYKHVLTWVCVPFFIAHCLIGHKEVRFFFPMVDALPILLVLPFQAMKLNIYKKWFYNVPIKIFWVMNLLLLTYFCFKPANTAFGLYNYLYDFSKTNGQTLLIINGHDPYDVGGNSINFHKAKNIGIKTSPSIDEILKQTDNETSKNILAIIDNTVRADSFEKKYPQYQLNYKSLPESFNNFSWTRNSMNKVWYVYQIKPK